MLSVESQSTMAGWDAQNSSAFYPWSRSHAPAGHTSTSHAPTGHVPPDHTPASHTPAHEDFVSKYLRSHTLQATTSPDEGFHHHHTQHHSHRSGLLFTSPRSGRRLSQTFGPSFCNKDNLEQCVSYLDQEMTVLGFPSLYPSSDRGQSGAFDVVLLVNCCYELIQRHQQHLHKQEEMETKQMRCDSDLEHLQSSQGRLKERLEQLERDNVALTEKERQHLNQNKSLAAKLKNAREELKKLENIVKHRDTQFKHDLKKKEREINKMKERIHQLLTDKNQERRIGMDILNSLQRADGKRATWKTGKTGTKHEEEMYRLIITNYEERQKEMMLENQVLRESLSNMQKELVDLLNRQGDKGLLSSLGDHSDEEDTTSVDDSSVDELSHGHFQMPFEMVREGIEASLRDKWQRLRERIQRMEKEQQLSGGGGGGGENKENAGGDPNVPGSENGPSTRRLEEEIAGLKDKVKVYHDIIQQQEQVLQSVQDSSMDEGLMALLKDSHFLEEKESMAEEKRLFYQQKAAFEKERRNFTDAAIRLGHERKKFEEERSSFLQQQLMLSPTAKTNSTPPLRPPKSIHTSSPSGFPLEQSPSTPPNERTPVGQRTIINTPTTVELYRALKLIPDREECLNSSRESLHVPSYYSDTDRSGASTPRSGAATPRSFSSQSSSRRTAGQTGSGLAGKGSSSSGRSERCEEQVRGQSQRGTPHHSHRTKKGEGPGKRK
ncbi:afadin- and alpha-actinin-binding protein A-like [Acanthaster planci]|uniref:Afadin- and alpha-actinin-binding protein A-like n=1 Tax=Acanthaster planci TaxID=133434 RepID=A0A8B7Y3T9_ACAPL|nr:afadin- and alpha-actinin-binding protein A-like [Acanthaster planci]XP_022087855.1 afadin- and alpha-actinin-binding protein A-like [Acanthaster planci]XP_022087856.1 afadin- and alpha-actinin-binding protein A-like [Acanthaster planci]XP_022087857.1 afadin- and alpha-actinin-binding protein A-like [Acanthaster planci]XP_022087858.1 afadin- and alpha-actinin-binding protein A-like [Acanthaster planci]XP_022087859.1 afadin- and alpha-actinin-binding protein A-like [Acanthaster planci]